MSLSLNNRVAIITGGARGIGKAIVHKFAGEGCSVVIADLREAEAMETISQISHKKPQKLFVKCDVSLGSQVQSLVDRVINTFGRIDILVNNAAISPPDNSLLDITEEEWDKVLAVNLKSVFLCCKSVVPYMKKQNYGKIVNVASVAAVSPGPLMADYSAAKSGVVALSRAFALEFAPFNICVNTLLPGITRTDLHDAIRPGGIAKSEYFSKLAKTIPLLKVADPEDIADVALFLASDLSRYVTGDHILASGGLR